MSVQRVRERRCISNPMCHRDRLLAQRRTPLPVSVGAERTGKTAQEPYPCWAVPLRKLSDCVLEQRHDVSVAAGAYPEVAAAVADGGPCELFGQSFAPCELGGREVCGLRRRLLARACLGFGEQEEKVATPGIVSSLLDLQALERHPLQARRILVPVEGRGAIACPARVVDRLIDVSPGCGLEEVERELGEMRLGVGRVELLQR